jgi:DNA-binding NtrC family response regulator
VFERSVVMLEPDAEIRPEDIPSLGETVGASSSAPRRNGDFPFPGPGELGEESYHAARERLVAEFEKRYLSWLVTQAGGNMSRAARIAGVDRTTLYRLMERHGLQRGTVTVGNE